MRLVRDEADSFSLLATSVLDPVLTRVFYSTLMLFSRFDEKEVVLSSIDFQCKNYFICSPTVSKKQKVIIDSYMPKNFLSRKSSVTSDKRVLDFPKTVRG